jgi:hypothetical protein
MSAPGILIVGEDLSALMLAATAAAVGRTAVLMSANTHVQPRPLPVPDDQRWQLLRRLLPAAEPTEWRTFLGGRRRDTPQALPIGRGDLLRAAEHGAWRELPADPGEGWSEPPDWPQWSANLSAAAERVGLRRMAKPQLLALQGGILRRARLIGAPPARRILIVDTPDVPASVVWPQAWPRTFADDRGAWWVPADGGSVLVAGRPRTPPGWASVVSAPEPRAELPWGVASCRGARVAAAPSAAGEAAAVWLAWLFEQLQWFGISRRDVGKASQVAV